MTQNMFNFNCLTSSFHVTLITGRARAFPELRVHPLAFYLQLVSTAMDHAGDVFRLNEDDILLSGMKVACLEGKHDIMEELVARFESHSEQLREASRFFVLSFLLFVF